MDETKKEYLSLTVEEKVGQLFFVGLPTDELDDDTLDLLQTVRPGGVCLFARNIKGASRTRDLLDGVRSALRFEPFLSLDQEGGLVDRLRRIVTPMPSASEIGGSADPANAAELGRISAEAIRILGFNMNFAPVVDVITGERREFSNGLFSRAFGDSPSAVEQFARIYLLELQAGGIMGCLKHFPGLAAANVDSHEELPQIDLSIDDLERCDLIPYRRMIDSGNVHAVMIAHAFYTRLQTADDQVPSSLSKAIVSELLRDRFGFKGLALTDDLEMGAIANEYGIPEACRMALEAGNDFLLICNSSEAVRESHRYVCELAVNGAISEERLNVSLERIFAARGELSPPLGFSLERLAELSEDIARLKESLSLTAAG